MNNQHLIETACFDICFSYESEAFSQQESLSSLVKNVLLKEIDDVFSDCTGDGQPVISIDQLEVDLGEIPFDGYQYEMKQRLRSRLREQLRQHLHRVKQQERLKAMPREMAVSEKIKCNEMALTEQSSIDFKAMSCFLLLGRFPWNYQGKSEQEIQQVLIRVIEKQFKALIVLLSSSANNECVVERLLDILPFDGVMTLSTRLLGGMFDKIQLLVGRFAEAHLAIFCLKNINQRDQQSCCHDLWRCVLKLLLRPGANYKSCGEIARALLVLCGGDSRSNILSDIVGSFEENRVGGIRRAGGEKYDVQQFHELNPQMESETNSGQLRGSETALAGMVKKTSGLAALGDIEKLSADDLVVMLTGNNSKGLKVISSQWDDVLATHANLLLRLLTIHTRKREVRRRLVRELSFHQLSEFITLISPGAIGFVNSVVALINSAGLAYERTETAALADKAVHGALSNERNLWGFTFDFFFVERGSRFNKKEYCGSLLRKMAAHNNCAYAELLTVMQQWLESIPGDSQNVTGLLSIINELSDPPQVEVIPEQEHVFSLYAECLICAFDGMTFSHGEVLLCEEYSKFYRSYLADGRQLSAEIFVRMFADHLMAKIASNAYFQYARVVENLKKNKKIKCSITREVIDILSEMFKQSGATTSISVVQETSPLQPAYTAVEGEVIYVKNAGQVLLSPYVPVLFERLKLVNQGRFVSHAASLRAVRTLQYLVDGKGDIPEHLMVLNKLICGVDSGRAVTRKMTLSGNEKSLIDGLIRSVIENWKVLGNTSIDGFRESFLQREGRLHRKNWQWHLLVESRSYDMLLDQLPWSYSTIKYAWMENVIHVEWR